MKSENYMYRIIYLLVVLLTLAQCATQQKTSISVFVINPFKDKPYLIDTKIPTNNDSFYFEGKVTKGGYFKKYIAIDSPEFKLLKLGTETKTIFLKPNYKLDIFSPSMNNDSGFLITGVGAIENTILDSVDNRISQFDFQKMYRLQPKSAAFYIDSVANTYQTYLQKLIYNKKVDPDFIKYEKLSINYYAAALKTLIGSMNRVTDSNYYAYLKSLEIENEHYLSIPNYCFLISQYNGIKANSIYAGFDSLEKNKPESRLTANIKAIETINNQKIREFLLFEAILQRLQLGGIKNIEVYKTYLYQHVTDQRYLNEFDKAYNKKMLLNAGNPAPKFALKDATGKLVGLDDFKGQFVYIDFWATWCAPCIKEIPAQQKLIESYKDKNIAFLAISIDTDIENWKTFLVSHASENCIQLFGNGGFSSEVATAYQLRGIPAYVLIDPDGKIIDVAAPSPSSPEIRKLLDSLLINKN